MKSPTICGFTLNVNGRQQRSEYLIKLEKFELCYTVKGTGEAIRPFAVQIWYSPQLAVIHIGPWIG